MLEHKWFGNTENGKHLKGTIDFLLLVGRDFDDHAHIDNIITTQRDIIKRG